VNKLGLFYRSCIERARKIRQIEQLLLCNDLGSGIQEFLLVNDISAYRKEREKEGEEKGKSYFPFTSQ
jgi:hypothetical protein